MQDNKAIEVQHVSKVYKLYDRNKDRLIDAFHLSRTPKGHPHYALRDLSFDVKKGECIGIIGTNGAGKSTILKIITGVLSPTEGQVNINGRISALLELGAGFNQEYTGMENIYLNGTMMGFSRQEIDEKLPDILSFADIGDFVNQPVKSYSSGMFVRLAFAVAINIEPEILIVDEALSVGDVFFQSKCYQKFMDFKEQGKTILFVSHDLGSISRYCDRVVLLNKGQKYAEGTPKEMVDLYKKLLVGADPAENATINDEDGALNEENFSGENTTKEGESFLTDKTWKSNFTINPNINEYGDKEAEIVDFGIFDENNLPSSNIEKGTRFKVAYKVKFHRDIQMPIFTLTIKTLQGVDVTGTNTMYEKKDVPLAKAGEEYEISFEQQMNLQGGEYLLSMSCTGYKDGEFTAYHRLYDVLNLTVISSKNTVGFFDMNSQVEVRKLGGE